MRKDNIIFLLAGLAIGAGGSYLYFKDQFVELLNKEVEDIKKYYEEKHEAEETLVSAGVEDKEPSIKVAPEKDTKEEEEKEPNYGEIIEKLNYNQYSTKPSTKKLAEKPYIITGDEYDSDVNFDKMMFSYFSEDEVLIDAQTDDVIQDIGKIVGYDNLEQITMSDDEEIYVRNEIEGCDYHIILETGSYSNYISGEL